MSAAPYSDLGYTSSMMYICIQTKGNDKGRSSCHITPSRLLSGHGLLAPLWISQTWRRSASLVGLSTKTSPPSILRTGFKGQKVKATQPLTRHVYRYVYNCSVCLQFNEIQNDTHFFPDKQVIKLIADQCF